MTTLTHPDSRKPHTLLLSLSLARGLIIALGIPALISCMAPAVAPVASSVAGPAVEKSDTLAHSGKYQSYQAVSIADTVSAIRKAASDLALQPVKEEKHPDQLKLIYKDDRKQEIVVTAVRRTQKETEIHVEVGILGVSGAGQLMMRQILADLPKSTTGKTDLQDTGHKTNQLSDEADEADAAPMHD
ncbi:MAG TPA: DUF3568 family protein [Phycisphaerae bacterium]|jgi:hypothetical protein